MCLERNDKWAKIWQNSVITQYVVPVQSETIQIFLTSKPHTQRELYKKEAKERWGNTTAYKEYSGKTKAYSKDKFESLADGMEEILAEFSVYMKNGASPDSKDVQSLVNALQSYITENYYTCTNEILAGLGQMYVMDERFRSNIDKHADVTSEFVKEAIEVYCGK